MIRTKNLYKLATTLLEILCPHPLRVAVDGIDAAGKTTLADELVQPIKNLGRPVIRACLDGFHRPQAERYRLGPESSLGYYQDSFDCAAIQPNLHTDVLIMNNDPANPILITKKIASLKYDRNYE